MISAWETPFRTSRELDQTDHAQAAQDEERCCEKNHPDLTGAGLYPVKAVFCGFLVRHDATLPLFHPLRKRLGARRWPAEPVKARIEK